VTNVIDDPTPMKTTYDPSNPAADSNGYVTMPNVDPVQEMVNMISASRSYQANVETLNTAKNLMLKTLTIGT
jgi:flagellar basal-body rod protein FlgC